MLKNIQIFAIYCFRSFGEFLSQDFAVSGHNGQKFVKNVEVECWRENFPVHAPLVVFRKLALLVKNLS
jgi:hypothetical protein